MEHLKIKKLSVTLGTWNFWEFFVMKLTQSQVDLKKIFFWRDLSQKNKNKKTKRGLKTSPCKIGLKPQRVGLTL